MDAEKAQKDERQRWIYRFPDIIGADIMGPIGGIVPIHERIVRIVEIRWREIAKGPKREGRVNEAGQYDRKQDTLDRQRQPLLAVQECDPGVRVLRFNRNTNLFRMK